MPSNPPRSAASKDYAVMHQDTIEQLDKSISEVFSLMLNRDCSPAPSCSPSEFAGIPQLQAHPGIVASISFSGALTGACRVHLPLRTAAVITGELVGPLAEDAANELNADTAGEICNMIAGSWKSRQPNPLATCALSTPLVTSADLQTAAPQTSAAEPATPTSFRHSLVRIYCFEDHCLHIELGFD